jgi:hypothetical protein
LIFPLERTKKFKHLLKPIEEWNQNWRCSKATAGQVVPLGIVNMPPSVKIAVTVDNCHVLVNDYARGNDKQKMTLTQNATMSFLAVSNLMAGIRSGRSPSADGRQTHCI